MKIAIIGTGFIGGTLGRALANAGHEVTFGSRRADDQVSSGTTARVASVGDALAGSDIVVLALPAAAVSDLSAEHGDALAGKVVIDATNRMGQAVANNRAS